MTLVLYKFDGIKHQKQDARRERNRKGSKMKKVFDDKI